MGRTAICKGLTSEATGITRIATNACGLAEDLSPCIVFIEDIDLIGQDRMEYGYHRDRLCSLSPYSTVSKKRTSWRR